MPLRFEDMWHYYTSIGVFVCLKKTKTNGNLVWNWSYEVFSDWELSDLKGVITNELAGS